jgi:hypothetical protein
MKNITIDSSGPNNELFILQTELTTSIIAGSLEGAANFPAADASGIITINIANLNSNARYMRLSCGQITDDSIITIDQEIT